MTELIYLLLASLTVNVCLALVVRALSQARDRTYRYAVDRADFSESGRAYSDMASAIVLDGKVDWGSNGTS